MQVLRGLQRKEASIFLVNINAFAEPPVAKAVGQTNYAPLGGRPYQLHGPTFSELDLALLKEFRTTENTRLEFRGEFFNLLNHPNFGNPGSLNIRNATTFGQITGTRGIAREIELALKLYF